MIRNMLKYHRHLHPLVEIESSFANIGVDENQTRTNLKLARLLFLSENDQN
jgi:hypothetical protein